MPTGAKMWGDQSIRGEKGLDTTGRCEPLQTPRALARRSMRVLTAIMQRATLAVLYPWEHLAFGHAIAFSSFSRRAVPRPSPAGNPWGCSRTPPATPVQVARFARRLAPLQQAAAAYWYHRHCRPRGVDVGKAALGCSKGVFRGGAPGVVLRRCANIGLHALYPFAPGKWRGVCPGVRSDAEGFDK